LSPTGEGVGGGASEWERRERREREEEKKVEAEELGVGGRSHRCFFAHPHSWRLQKREE